MFLRGGGNVRNLNVRKAGVLFFARGGYEPEIIFSLSNIFASTIDRAADTKALHKTVTRICHGAYVKENTSPIDFTELNTGIKYAHAPILSPRNIFAIAATITTSIKGPT